MAESIRRFVVIVVLFVTGAAGPVTQAGGDTAARRDCFEAIKADYDKQLTAFRKAATEAKTDADRESGEKLRPSLNEFGNRFLALAEEKPADEVACDALIWFAENYGRREMQEFDGALD